MEGLLKEISEKMEIELLKPAEKLTVLKVEEKLNVTFPDDYKQFLLISNGFSSTDYTEPSFLSIEEIDYLKNIETDTIEAYSIEGLEEVGKQLERSILIAGKEEEQYFLLIPPISKEENWKYWKFANWIPGEQEYENLEKYFKEVLEFINETNE